MTLHWLIDWTNSPIHQDWLIDWQNQFTKVPFKPLSDQDCKSYRFFFSLEIDCFRLRFLYKWLAKELSLWNKIKYLNHNIFRTRSCKPLIFQTQISWSNRIQSLKYLRYATFGSKDKVIRKSELVAKTQFL